jgi:ProP effector
MPSPSSPQLFPRTFFTAGAERRPLKVGISHDLLAADTGMSKAQVRGALRFYCGSIGYLANMAEGAARVDLAGDPTGIVTADEAAHAARRLTEIKTAIEAQWEQARQRHQERKRAKPAPTPQPQRLSLAGLKAAALARRQLR